MFLGLLCCVSSLTVVSFSAGYNQRVSRGLLQGLQGDHEGGASGSPVSKQGVGDVLSWVSSAVGPFFDCQTVISAV